MKVTNEYVLELQQLNRRMDNIEKLMNMILLNDLIDDVEGVTAKEKNTKKEVLKKESTRVRIADIKRDTEITIDPYLLKLLNHYNLDIGEQGRVCDINVVYILMPRHMGTAIGDVIYLNKKFKERYPEMEPVFKYETINGMHRKRLMKEKISFCVKGKEMRIYGAGQ